MSWLSSIIEGDKSPSDVWNEQVRDPVSDAWDDVFSDDVQEWWNEKIFKHNQKQVYTSSVYDYGKGQRLQIIFEKEK